MAWWSSATTRLRRLGELSWPERLLLLWLVLGSAELILHDLDGIVHGRGAFLQDIQGRNVKVFLNRGYNAGSDLSAAASQGA